MSEDAPTTGPFALPATDLPLPPPTRAVLERQWADLAHAGSWWTGAERVAIVEVARAARDGRNPIAPDRLSPAAREAAASVGAEAGALTSGQVDGFVADDLSVEAYVELVGLVARTAAIDTALTGVGADPAPLPSPEPGEPLRPRRPDARRRSAWVPTVGPAGATTALTAVEAEDRAQAELHGALYLSYDEMGDLDAVKGLDRTQMELVASRTSFHNDCYF